MVAGGNAGHAFATFDHDACALVPQHGGENAFRVVTAERKSIGVADASVGDADEHFAFLRWRDINLNHLQGLACGKGNGGAGFDHAGLSSINKREADRRRRYLSRQQKCFDKTGHPRYEDARGFEPGRKP